MKPKFSIFGLLWLLLGVCAAFCLLLIFQAQDLTDIEGRAAAGPAPVDLLQHVTAAVTGGQDFECSETALNQYVNGLLEAKELSDAIEFKGLWVRLHDGEIELIFEREVMGKATTVAASLSIEQRADGHVIRVSGGRFGRLPVPAGFARLLTPALVKLGKVFEAEKEVLSRSDGLTISSGWLRLSSYN